MIKTIDDLKPFQKEIRSRLVFGMYSIRILPGTPNILGDGFRGFTMSLQANIEKVPLLGHHLFPPNPL